jgi:hypothetical protein
MNATRIAAPNSRLSVYRVRHGLVNGLHPHPNARVDTELPEIDALLDVIDKRG